MKKALIFLGIFVVLVVMAVLTAPGFINWNTWRDHLASQISRTLGHDVVIAGDVRFRVLPYPMLSAGDVTIANSRDGEYENMLSLRDLDVRMSLLPLLRGRVVVDRVILVEPVLAVERMPTGALNWSVMGNGGQSLRDAVELERITIENGAVYWRDHVDGAGASFSSIFGQVSADSLNGPFMAIGSMVAGGVPVTVDGRLGRPGDDGIAAMDLTVGMDGAAAEASLRGLFHTRGPRLELDVNASGASLASLVAKLAGDGVSDFAPDRPFSVSGRLLGSTTGVRFQDAEVTVDETRIRGAISVDTALDRRIDIEITSNRLDLDTLGVSPDGERLAAIIDGAARLWSPAGRSAPIISLDLALDAVSLRGALIRQLRLDALVADGVVVVNRFSGDFPGTTDVTIIGTLREEAGAPYADLVVDGRSSDLRRLLAWLGIDQGGIPADRLRRMSGTAALAGWRHDFLLSDIDMTIDTTTVQGLLGARRNGAHQRPVIDINLSLNRLDLDAYGLTDMAAAAFADQSGIVSDRESGGQIVEKIAEQMGLADVDIVLTADNLVLAGAELVGVDMDMSARNGAITVRRAIVDQWGQGSIAIFGSVDQMQSLAGLDVLFNIETGDVAGIGPSFWSALVSEWSGLDPVNAGRLISNGLFAGHIQGDALAVDIALDGRVAGLSVSVSGVVSDPLTLWPAPEPDPEQSGRPSRELAQGSGSSSFDLSLRADHPDFAGFLAGAGYQAAASRLPAGRQAVLDATLVGTAQDIEMSDMRATLAGMDVSGDGRLTVGDNDAPHLVLEAVSSDLDTEAYLPFLSGLADHVMARDDGVSADITLRSSRWLTPSPGIHISNPEMALRLSGGGIIVDRLQGSVSGGDLAVSGSIHPDRSTGLAAGSLRAEGDISITNASMEDLATSALGAGGVSGTVSLHLTGDAGLNDLRVDIDDFSGAGRIEWRDPVVHGLDLVAIDAALSEPTGPVAFLESLRQGVDDGATRLEDMTIDLRLSDGIVVVNDLMMETEVGSAVARGTFDPSRWYLDLTSEFYFRDRLGAPALSVRIAGAPQAPTRQFQTGALQAFVAQRAADAIGRNLDGDAAD